MITRIKYTQLRDGTYESSPMLVGKLTMYVRLFPQEKRAEILDRHENTQASFTSNDIPKLKRLVRQWLQTQGANLYEEIRGRT
jgi:hypothetical protein